MCIGLDSTAGCAALRRRAVGRSRVTGTMTLGRLMPRGRLNWVMGLHVENKECVFILKNDLSKFSVYLVSFKIITRSLDLCTVLHT
jgi:hypothetical protein